MANRFFNPNEQFCDATGAPYAGGSLTFYASGTTTPLNTYSDKALTIANTNPVVLDSAGRAGTIFLQNLAYKVVLEDVNNVVIWTMDPVYSSDFSTVAQFQSGNGSPNGVLAGTAGSSTIPASSYWDATNDILYVCTQTGNAASAVWTAVNSSSASNVVPVPQGYLTLTSATPIIPSDVTASANVYYTPYVGNLIPIYNGTSFTTTAFSELNLTLTSSQASNGIYDAFVFNNFGVVTVCVGPEWTNVTAGSCARGTGAGTTQLSRISGIWVNSVQISARNGSNTYTIPANQATYVGSIYIDSAAGQVSCYRSYGQSRKWGVWNAYNRVPIYLKAGDGTSSWSYTTNTVRAINGNSANSLTVFCGLPEEVFNLSYSATNLPVAVSGGQLIAGQVGVGFNSTTSISGKFGIFQFDETSGSNSFQLEYQLEAKYFAAPSLGINIITALESGLAATSSIWQGGEGSCLLAGQWRG